MLRIRSIGLVYFRFAVIGLAGNSEPDNDTFASIAIARHVVETYATDTNIWEDQAPGGYLFRFRYDVDTDGRIELFVGTSLEAHRGFGNFSIFRQKENGPIERMGDNIVLSGDGFWLSTARGRPSIKCEFPGVGAERFVSTYVFYPDRVIALETVQIAPRHLQAMSESEMNRAYNLGRFVSIELEKVSLVEFLENIHTNWRPLAPAEFLTAQFNDPADQNLVQRLKGVTIERAHQLLAEAEAQLPKETITPPEKIANNPSASLPPPTQTPQGASNATPSALVAVISLVGAAGVLIWWVRRKGT